MKLKPFQRATASKVVEALSMPGSSRRFLVADEVGLGKTRVAQHVILGLRTQEKRHLQVFYVCSSLSIIHQNREALLDILPPSLRSHARVTVDRLTLLPTVPVSRKASFTLYTLTPGTLPGGRRTGRADERAVMWQLLCTAIPNLAKQKSIKTAFRRGIEYWDVYIDRAGPRLDTHICSRFRRELARELELAGAPQGSTLIQKMKLEIDEKRDRELIAKCRLALSRAALDQLSPDLIIFDEFQRFFEILVPGQDDDPISRQIVEHLLSTREHKTPAVLLLSATPYRLFSGWKEGAHAHYEQFFELVAFLFGTSGRTNVEALREDFRIYRNMLQADPVGSKEIFDVRDRIITRLATVMSRMERPRSLTGTRHLEFKTTSAPVEPLDIRFFRHLSESAKRDVDRVGVPAYWSSIPYPLQMMDNRYGLFEHAEPPPLEGEARQACISWRAVRRFAPIAHPHPKLRALLEGLPPEFLALPWIPPTLPWWPLGGIFGEATRRLGGITSKGLIFSRFRAVPRGIAAVLSYEAERYCFARDQQRSRGVKPIAYEYRTKKESHPLAGLRKRPGYTFTFPLSSKEDLGMGTFLMFVPLPELARLGDPLSVIRANSQMSFDETLKIVEGRIVDLLGLHTEKCQTKSIWPWAVAIERSSRAWDVTETALKSWIEDPSENETGDDENYTAGFRLAVSNFLLAKKPSRSPNSREVRELAELALLAPGNVLYRVVERVFDEHSNPYKRITSVTSTSITGLRTYLDLPDFHLLLRNQHHRQHPIAIRRAIWDGNLESVLDEHCAMLRGLGATKPEQGIEEKILSSLTQALTVGAGSVTVHETGASVTRAPFRMRCHAALPFGLTGEEKESGSGKLHNDDLRVSFNSPFRPHVLATTSIGQEGLDFHVWSRHVIHWDLPSNPVDLEQRDGRVDRYGGLAIRQALARIGPSIRGTGSPWRNLAEAQEEHFSGLEPWWICQGATILRSIFVPPFSKMTDDLQTLRDHLSIYRLALGQPDQEALIHTLQRRVAEAGLDETEILAWLEESQINLAPKVFA